MRSAPLAILIALAFASPALAQAGQQTQTLSVTGTGEAELKPDFARLLVAVETQGDTVGKAVDANRSSSEDVLNRIQGLGIRKEDIRTETFQVFETPTRTDKNGNEIKVPKFTASHHLRITTHDLGSVGRLAGEILASSNMLFQSVSFGLDRQEEGEDQARRAAVNDAKRQAQVYADAAAVGLGRILEIRDGTAQPYEAGIELRRGIAAAPKAAGDAPIVPPETLRYTASVNLVWDISPKP